MTDYSEKFEKMRIAGNLAAKTLDMLTDNIKEGISNLISQDSIVYTSGTGAIFKSGIPIGKVDVEDTGSSKKFKVDFYSDFSQLKYVFAEIVTKIDVKN